MGDNEWPTVRNRIIVTTLDSPQASFMLKQMTISPKSDENPAAPTARPKMVPWIGLVVMMGLGIALAVVKNGGGDGAHSLVPDVADVAGKTVTLVIDFGGEKPGDGKTSDQKREFSNIAWWPKMTVADLLDRMAQLPDAVPYQHQGQGELTFLLSIDGVESQGGDKNAKNWIFYISGKMGQQSYATTVLKPGDTVLWKFAAYEYNGS